MKVERQQQTPKVNHGAIGEGGTGPEAHEVSQAFAVSLQPRALATDLMERVCERSNLNLAFRRVKANKGAPGVDGMSVDALGAWIAEHKDEFLASLLDGRYRPSPVRGVEMSKPGGGMRQLGIPTVRDRLVQQAILQVLTPIIDAGFSESSYGFRPGRSAHDALRAAAKYVADGRRIVVDIDLEKFFDRVNHDILMSRLARRVGDKRMLGIVRRFLQAGMTRHGVDVERHEGTPQGGPLSPLLANILLDDLDKELEKRGHCFCRYADDCNIYVSSVAAGERVMKSVTRFLANRLRLRVNVDKSAVAGVGTRKFLGYRILQNGTLSIAPASLKRLKVKVRELTRRNSAQRLEEVIRKLNETIPGWVAYFRLAPHRSLLEGFDQWTRRRLRCLRLKQLKRTYTMARFCIKQGVPEWQAWVFAKSGKGWWRLAGSPQANQAMNNEWLKSLGLISALEAYGRLS